MNMSWRCIALLVFLFSKVKLHSLNLSEVDPVLLEQFLGLGNDTMENQNFYQFTTVNIFQPKFFPHDDPNFLAILRKHLENSKNRKRSIKRVVEAFEKDKKKLKENERQDFIKGLKTKIWPSLIPMAFMRTPQWFLKKTSDRIIFCHLCLITFEDRAMFDKHYVRHFTDFGTPCSTKRTRKISRTVRMTRNTTYKIRRRVLRRKTTESEILKEAA